MDEFKMRKYSILAIRNAFGDKFLLYYDNQWECWFFPNVKTQEDNEQNILDFIDFKFDAHNVSLKNVVTDAQDKVHPSGENRTYIHTIYEVVINELPERMKEESFELNDIKYKWMTINEMEQDANTMEKNRDVVHLVKDNIR